TLTSGIPSLDFAAAVVSLTEFGVVDFESLLMLRTREGAGTTLVMPSGPSGCFACCSRRRSAAPPARGLKALAALAALRKVFATSTFDFFFLIMGPRPGRSPSGVRTGDCSSF